MEKNKGRSLLQHVAGLEDPRVDRTKRHNLLAIVTIALCGVICGAESWVQIEEFGLAKEVRFASFLDLPHGIPSHDTFGRVFAALDPEQFEQCFRAWVASIVEVMAPQVIALEGKSARRAHAPEGGPLHTVSAWARATGLVLAQRAVAAKGNECGALPEVLRVLALEGCIVTIDAMGTHAEIATQSVEGKGDYILALKGNQERMHDDVRALVADAQAVASRGIGHRYHRDVDKGHGRIEIRETWAITEPSYLAYADPSGTWTGLRSLVMVRAERRRGTMVSQETRYSLSSLETSAKRIGAAVRAHGGSENGLHWVLDVAFREDESRAYSGHAAHNLSLLRHLALNLLKRETSRRIGIQTKRLKAGWDQAYLLKVLQA